MPINQVHKKETKTPQHLLQTAAVDMFISQPRTPPILQNENGGVLITQEEIHEAFTFIDKQGLGYITVEDIQARLDIFCDSPLLQKMKKILHDESVLTEEYLSSILTTNDVKDFDPIQEAFKVYDPEDTGYISREMLQYIFEQMGYEHLTNEDIELLLEYIDADKDGQITLQDFRSIFQPS